LPYLIIFFSISTLHTPYIVSASTLVQQDALRESLAILAAPCFKPTPTPMTAREISKLLTTHSHHRNQVRLMSEDSSVPQTALVDDLPTPDSGKDALIGSRGMPYIARHPTITSRICEIGTKGQPQLSASLNPQYLNASKLPKAYELQRQQKFGKDTVNQSFTCDKSGHHVLLLLYKIKFLRKRELVNKLWHPVAVLESWRLFNDWMRTKNLPFWELRNPSRRWKDQSMIADMLVDMRMALLFHYNNDLAAVMRFLGGEHIASHRDPDLILPQVEGLISSDVYNDLERIMQFGAPAKFNEHGTRQQFLEYRDYGNHMLLTSNLTAFQQAMNKEDKRNYILTFPAYLKDYIPDLWLTPNGLIQIPSKKDRPIFDASFLLHAYSRVYNNLVSNDDEPTIIFGNAWTNFLRSIYNLRITHPDKEIYLMDDDVVAAFRQVKYHPNVISAKAYSAGRYLFVPTGSTFSDKSSPPGFEPFAQARMALAKYLDSNGAQSVPAYEEYLDAVQFADLPNETVTFVQACPDCFNPSVLDSNGDPLPTEYNMYVDDNLYAQVGQERMNQAMRCSIHALNVVMGGPDLKARPNPTDLDKFLREPVSHHRRQVGYIVNTHRMIVMIPEDKRKAMVKVLSMTWGEATPPFLHIG
jgi:hypothetical protein